ncbi:MAG: phosphoglycerate dehydrogenase [Phycisphaerales bacterium]|nr:MAG: phosphoglycerate dehydrogenase [Phycisphaerales bacterium]
MKTSYPKDKIRVVLAEGVHAAAVDRLKDEGFAVETIAGAPSSAKLRALLGSAHVLGIRSKTSVLAEHLASAPRLLAIGCFCIGTDQVDLLSARGAGVAVFNSPFSNTRSVAELTLAEIIALHRRIPVKNIAMHAGTWDKSASGAHEVRGRTLGIVGYGHIGAQVSVLAEAIGMRVIFHDVVPKLALGNARPVRSLADLLKEADVVTLHVPDEPSTRKLITTAHLKKMKRGSILINNARGAVVDIPAVADAIKSGHLAGAAFDVFPSEPSAKDEPFESELRGLPNVLLTPHIGGSTEEAQEAIGLDVAEKLVRFINVGATTGAVNVPQVDLAEQPTPHPTPVATAGAGTPPPPPPPPRPHRILYFHRNVPGVLGSVHRVIAEVGANISAEHLRTEGDLGYVILDVDPTSGGGKSTKVLEKLREIPETVRLRILW